MSTMTFTPVGGAAARTDPSQVRWLFGLLQRVAEWAGERRDRVAFAYLIPEADAVGLYLVGSRPEFDFDLNRELAAFAVRLTADEGLAVHALLLPGGTETEPPGAAITIFPGPTPRPADAE